jgi:hypothetical protein
VSFCCNSRGGHIFEEFNEWHLGWWLEFPKLENQAQPFSEKQEKEIILPHIEAHKSNFIMMDE